ncbi:MAG: hypothetical protein RL434_2451 [Pseudomonadota bacterium]
MLYSATMSARKKRRNMEILMLLGFSSPCLRRVACLGSLTLALGMLPLGAMAVTIMECRDADGTLSYRDACPPGSERIGSRRLGSATSRQQPSPEEVAKAHPVTLYVVTECDTCDLVRLLLQKRGIPFAERDVERDPSLQRELLELSGATKVPTVLIGQEAMPGFDRVLLQQRLSEVGYPLENLPADR